MSNDPRRYEVWICPRCHNFREPQFPALSRFDNKSYICGTCGAEEAMLDFKGIPLTGPDDWDFKGIPDWKL